MANSSSMAYFNIPLAKENVSLEGSFSGVGVNKSLCRKSSVFFPRSIRTTPTIHRLRLGLFGYLIPCAPLAFVSQCQCRPNRMLLPLNISLSAQCSTPKESPIPDDEALRKDEIMKKAKEDEALKEILQEEKKEIKKIFVEDDEDFSVCSKICSNLDSLNMKDHLGSITVTSMLEVSETGKTNKLECKRPGATILYPLESRMLYGDHLEYDIIIWKLPLRFDINSSRGHLIKNFFYKNKNVKALKPKGHLQMLVPSSQQNEIMSNDIEKHAKRKGFYEFENRFLSSGDKKLVFKRVGTVQRSLQKEVLLPKENETSDVLPQRFELGAGI